MCIFIIIFVSLTLLISYIVLYIIMMLDKSKKISTVLMIIKRENGRQIHVFTLTLNTIIIFLSPLTFYVSIGIFNAQHTVDNL